MANDKFTRLKRIRAWAHDFVTERNIGHEDDARRSLIHRVAHFWLLVGKSFIRNRCPLRASALAYTTLLALIPLLAVGFSIMTSLLQKAGDKPAEEMVDRVVDELVNNVAPALNLEVKESNADVKEGEAGLTGRQRVIKQITKSIGNVQSGTLGVSSTIALIFVAIGLLRTIEATFNDIWGVSSGRSWLVSIIQYWAVISLGPLIVGLMFVVTTSPHYTKTAAIIEDWPFIGSLAFQLLPYAVLSIAFALLYQFMPNTRVAWRAAAVGGAVGGTLWQLNNKLSVFYVSKAVTYSNLYGPLSTIPLFLIGIYFSWLILLFGAQVAYAFQNRQSYLQEKLAETVNQRGREFIALRIMTRVAQRFLAAQPSEGVIELAAALAVPTRLVSRIVHLLVEGKWLVEGVGGGETRYTPARPLEQITVHDILHCLRAGQGLELQTSDDPSGRIVRSQFDQVTQAEHDAGRTITLEALAREANALAIPTPIVRSA